MKLKSTIATILVVLLAFVSGALFTGAWGTMAAYADQPPTATPCDDGEGSTGDCHGNPDGDPPGDPDPNPQGCTHGEPDCESTPEPTAVPTGEPTVIPTEEPTAVPTDTPTDTPGEPTPTNVPGESTPTPTDAPPQPTPVRERLPNTGVIPASVDPFTWAPELWREEGFADNVWFTHNGSDTAGFGSKLVSLERGNTFSHPALGNVSYEVTGVMRVLPEDTWALGGADQYRGIVVVTCSGYNTQTQTWKYRVIVFLQELPQ